MELSSSQAAKLALQRMRGAMRSALGLAFVRQARRHLQRKVSGRATYCAHLTGKHALEIGGPSGIFSKEGSLPVYDVLSSVDNCVYSAHTLWNHCPSPTEGFLYQAGKAPGRSIICEGSDLRHFGDESYDCVLASHCLEHIANPLRALREWRRVLVQNGLLLAIVPHKDGTFDWRRPPTTLSHMISDYQQNIGEEDLTHLCEILELHDLARDKAAGTADDFHCRCLKNLENRAMHHHVFKTMTVLQALDWAGFLLIRVDHLKPYHIIVLAQRADQSADNRAFLSQNAAYWRRSPFPSDHLHLG